MVSLLVSVGFNIYLSFWGFDSYLQSTEQIYIMESGILHNNLVFRDGENYKFSYDFKNEEYAKLIENYNIDKVAGNGTSLSALTVKVEKSIIICYD